MKNLDDETMVNRSANYNNNEDTVVKDEETLLNDKETDDTMYDDDEDTNPAFRDDKEYNEVPQQKSGWKKVVMGGVAGIVLGHELWRSVCGSTPRSWSRRRIRMARWRIRYLLCRRMGQDDSRGTG